MIGIWHLLPETVYGIYTVRVVKHSMKMTYDFYLVDCTTIKTVLLALLQKVIEVIVFHISLWLQAICLPVLGILGMPGISRFADLQFTTWANRCIIRWIWVGLGKWSLVRPGQIGSFRHYMYIMYHLRHNSMPVETMRVLGCGHPRYLNEDLGKRHLKWWYGKFSLLQKKVPTWWHSI